MDISSNNPTTCTWCMGNQFLFDQLPFGSIYPTEENPLQIHPTQSTSHVPNSIIQTHQVPNSSVAVLGQRTDQKEEEEEEDELGSMKEMMYKIAAMQPVDIDPATIEKPKRRNIRISDDPQSIAARRRRERISERIRILQRLVPGGTKMDTATMLDEAARYMKFLKKLVQELQTHQPSSPMGVAGLWTTADRSSGAVALGPYSSMVAPQGTRFSYT